MFFHKAFPFRTKISASLPLLKRQAVFIIPQFYEYFYLYAIHTGNILPYFLSLRPVRMHSRSFFSALYSTKTARICKQHKTVNLREFTGIYGNLLHFSLDKKRHRCYTNCICNDRK